MRLAAVALKLALLAAAVPHPQPAEPKPKPHKPRWRKALASVYGTGRPGDTSSGPLGCARRFRGAPAVLSPGLVGVANKSLPCGSKLTLGYRGRAVRVRVIDRGPFSGHREFDLTAGAAGVIRFPITVAVVKWRRGWHR